MIPTNLRGHHDAMTPEQHDNAIRAREDKGAAARAVIVAGNVRQAELWRSRITPAVDQPGESGRAPLVVAERGRKGNLLGTLQAYQTAFLTSQPTFDPQSLHQIVM